MLPGIFRCVDESWPTKVRRRPLLRRAADLAERLFGIVVPFHTLVEREMIVVVEVCNKLYKKLLHRRVRHCASHGAFRD